MICPDTSGELWQVRFDGVQLHGRNGPDFLRMESLFRHRQRHRQRREKSLARGDGAKRRRGRRGADHWQLRAGFAREKSINALVNNE